MLGLDGLGGRHRLRNGGQPAVGDVRVSSLARRRRTLRLRHRDDRLHERRDLTWQRWRRRSAGRSRAAPDGRAAGRRRTTCRCPWSGGTAGVGISQPGASQHLRVLRDHGIVQVRAEAARRIYSLNAGALAELDSWLDRFRTDLGSAARRVRRNWLAASASAAKVVARFRCLELVRPDQVAPSTRRSPSRDVRRSVAATASAKGIAGRRRIRVEHPHFDIGAPAGGVVFPGGDDPAAIQHNRR